MELKDYENKIVSLYKKYFKKLEIKEEKPYKNDRIFHAFPFIGSNYYKSKIKVLFISLSKGVVSGKKIKEEKINIREKIRFLRKRIEEQKGTDKEPHNAHISGTYFQALYCLRKEKKSWQELWDKFKKIKDKRKKLMTCYTILKEYRSELLENDNLLSYIAYTDFCKIEINSKKDRQHDEESLNKNEEENLLMEEIENFNPDIVIFQSKKYATKKRVAKIRKLMKNKRMKICAGLHPSNPTKPPKELINSYRKNEEKGLDKL